MQWTTQEVARLRALARTMPVVDIVLMMPGRSYDSVVDAAKRYGISLQTPRGLAYCHECGEFRTKAPCPVCRERALLKRARARQAEVFQKLPVEFSGVYMRQVQGSRIEKVPPVPDYKGAPEIVRAQCIEREAALVANIHRMRRAMEKRNQRMAKKVRGSTGVDAE